MVQMPNIDSAIEQLNRHSSIKSIGKPQDIEGQTFLNVDVAVELPSRAKADKTSITGVQEIESCLLVFPANWPMSAPRPFLRSDFPLNFPHINPHRKGEPVSPCIFEGSIDELLHRFGLDAVIDQLVEWLKSAASGNLINLAQGWEPTRRDSCPSTIIFSAEDVVSVIPKDGSILAVSADHYGEEYGGLSIPDPTFAPAPANLTFMQEFKPGTSRWGAGHTIALFIQAPFINDHPQVGLTYQADSVHDLDTLLQNAESLNIDSAAIRTKLTEFFQLSILNQVQHPTSWPFGLDVVVCLAVTRPAPLIGSSGRTVEILPYLIRYKIDADSVFNQDITAHAAFHNHSLSPALLASTSGIPVDKTSKIIVLIGCGSLGSKIAMHLGRAGFGHLVLVDKEKMSPHNAARHALTQYAMSHIAPEKAPLLSFVLDSLKHQTKAFTLDAVSLFNAPIDEFTNVVTQETELIIETTASLQVMAAEIGSPGLEASKARLVRVLMYGQGRSVMLLLEGLNRNPRIDDLTAYAFEHCRTNELYRISITGETTEHSRVFTGDNCTSLTMPMSDATVSRSASITQKQIERWLVDGVPEQAVICAGLEGDEGIGMTWSTNQVGPTVIIEIEDDGGWIIRVLDKVVKFVHADSKRWGKLETGGALVGKVDINTKTIIIAGIVEAPDDSDRQEAKFILGKNGLIAALKTAHQDSLGYLHFIGTWHSHPMGGNHSGLDRETLHAIAKEAGGIPAVSLVWTPDKLICAVDRW